MVDLGANLLGKAMYGGAALVAGAAAGATLLLCEPARAQGTNQVAGSGIGLPAGPASTGVGSQFEMVFWQSIDSGNDPALYEAYLGRYPDGTFASVARVKIAKLRQMSGGAAVPASIPAPVSPPAAMAGCSGSVASCRASFLFQRRRARTSSHLHWRCSLQHWQWRFRHKSQHRRLRMPPSTPRPELQACFMHRNGSSAAASPARAEADASDSSERQSGTAPYARPCWRIASACRMPRSWPCHRPRRQPPRHR